MRVPCCRLVGSLIAVIGVLLIIVEQYLVPTIANSLIPVSSSSCSICCKSHLTCWPVTWFSAAAALKAASWPPVHSLLMGKANALSSSHRGSCV